MNLLSKYKNLILIAGILFFGSSCTYFKKSLDKTDNKMDQRTKELINAAKSASEHTKYQLVETTVLIDKTNWFDAKMTLSAAKEANNLSIDFLKRGEGLVGLPLKDQTKTVNDLLSTNKYIKQAAESAAHSQFKQEQEWRAAQQDREQKLIEYGTKFEAERNNNIIKRFWNWSVGLLGIGGIIALVIFFPICIPIFAKIIGVVIGWVVNVFPKIADFVGLSLKKTLDNSVKGIGAIRTEIKNAKEHAPKTTYTPEEVLKIIDNNLKIELDGHDKKTIENIREKLNV